MSNVGAGFSRPVPIDPTKLVGLDFLRLNLISKAGHVTGVCDHFA